MRLRERGMLINGRCPRPYFDKMGFVRNDDFALLNSCPASAQLQLLEGKTYGSRWWFS